MAHRILLDSNSLGYAAHRSAVLKAGDQEVQAVYGLIKTIRTLRVRNPDATIIALWDGLSWRKSKSTVYKANRDDTPEKAAERKRYKSQTPLIRRAFKLLGIPQLFAVNLEADDLAAKLVKQYVAKGDRVNLITGDQDWIQLVGPQVEWEDHRSSSTRKVTHRNFADETGVQTPLQYVQVKALQGDISDNLPGVGKIGEVYGRQLINVWGSVEAMLADPDPAGTFKAKTGKKTLPKCFADFHSNVDGRQEKYFHNMQMMDLRGDEIPKPEKMTLSKGDFDPDGFRRLCHELAFQSIYMEGRFDLFTEPFRTKH